MPSSEPSVLPSASPSVASSELPSESPSGLPSQAPSWTPSIVPSSSPTTVPSVLPSASPGVGSSDYIYQLSYIQIMAVSNVSGGCSFIENSNATKNALIATVATVSNISFASVTFWRCIQSSFRQSLRRLLYLSNSVDLFLNVTHSLAQNVKNISASALITKYSETVVEATKSGLFSSTLHSKSRLFNTHVTSSSTVENATLSSPTLSIVSIPHAAPTSVPSERCMFTLNFSFTRTPISFDNELIKTVATIMSINASFISSSSIHSTSVDSRRLQTESPTLIIALFIDVPINLFPAFQSNVTLHTFLYQILATSISDGNFTAQLDREIIAALGPAAVLPIFLNVQDSEGGTVIAVSASPSQSPLIAHSQTSTNLASFLQLVSNSYILAALCVAAFFLVCLLPCAFIGYYKGYITCKLLQKQLERPASVRSDDGSAESKRISPSDVEFGIDSIYSKRSNDSIQMTDSPTQQHRQQQSTKYQKPYWKKVSRSEKYRVDGLGFSSVGSETDEGVNSVIRQVYSVDLTDGSPSIVALDTSSLKLDTTLPAVIKHEEDESKVSSGSSITSYPQSPGQPHLGTSGIKRSPNGPQEVSGSGNLNSTATSQALQAITDSIDDNSSSNHNSTHFSSYFFTNAFFRGSRASSNPSPATLHNEDMDSLHDMKVDDLYPEKAYDVEQVNVVSRLPVRSVAKKVEREKDRMNRSQDSIALDPTTPLDIRFKATREKFESMIVKNNRMRRSDLPPHPPLTPNQSVSDDSSSSKLSNILDSLSALDYSKPTFQKPKSETSATWTSHFTKISSSSSGDSSKLTISDGIGFRSIQNTSESTAKVIKCSSEPAANTDEELLGQGRIAVRRGSSAAFNLGQRAYLSTLPESSIYPPSFIPNNTLDNTKSASSDSFPNRSSGAFVPSLDEPPSFSRRVPTGSGSSFSFSTPILSGSLSSSSSVSSESASADRARGVSTKGPRVAPLGSIRRLPLKIEKLDDAANPLRAPRTTNVRSPLQNVLQSHSKTTSVIDVPSSEKDSALPTLTPRPVNSALAAEIIRNLQIARNNKAPNPTSVARRRRDLNSREL